MTDQQSLVLGELRVYRAWRFSPYGLRPYVKTFMAWHKGSPAEVYKAECAVSAFSSADIRADHTVPSRWCTCGFYGVYAGGFVTLMSVLFGTLSLNRLWEPESYEVRQKYPVVYGSAALSGRTILDVNGIGRAANMHVEAIFSSNVHLLKLLATYHCIPCFDDVDDFHRSFPLQDLTHLGNPTCEINEAEVAVAHEAQKRYRRSAPSHWRSPPFKGDYSKLM